MRTLMPRLTQPRRADLTSPVVQATMQRVFGDRDPVTGPGTETGSPGDWWTTMAIEPGIFELIELRHEWQKSPERALDPVLREMSIVRAGWARGSQFVFSQHCKLLRRLGVTEERIAAIPDWATASCFDARERVVLAYVDDLVLASGRVPDARFAELRRLLSDVEILELTFIACTYEMSATMSRALRLEFDDRPDPVVEVAAPSEVAP
jgi:AhpD family alkylhydroperoxidase